MDRLVFYTPIVVTWIGIAGILVTRRGTDIHTLSKLLAVTGFLVFGVLMLMVGQNAR